MKVQIPSGRQPSTRPMQEWFTKELVHLCGNYAMPHGFLLGCPVWGEAFIDRFTRYCLPSMFAPSNLETFDGSNAAIILYTDMPGFLRLQDVMSYVERLRVKVVLRIIPQDVLDDVSQRPGAVYEVLGIVQNLLVKMAARCGAGLHVMYPDVAYSDGYFRRLAALTVRHSAIVQSCFSVDETLTLPFLDKYRDEDGFLVVPPTDMWEISWQCRHKQTAATLLEPTAEFPTGWPKSHMVIWKGRNSVQIACPHTNPVWLAPSVCALAPMLPPSTLDAQLPQIITGDFHVAQPEDRLAFLEISTDDKEAPQNGIEESAFVKEWWSRVNFDDDYLRFAAHRSHILIREGVGLPDFMIDAQHEQMLRTLVDGKKDAAMGVVGNLVRYPPVMMGFGAPPKNENG